MMMLNIILTMSLKSDLLYHIYEEESKQFNIGNFADIKQQVHRDLFAKEQMIGHFFFNDILEINQLNRLTPSIALKMIKQVRFSYHELQKDLDGESDKKLTYGALRVMQETLKNSVNTSSNTDEGISVSSLVFTFNNQKHPTTEDSRRMTFGRLFKDSISQKNNQAEIQEPMSPMFQRISFSNAFGDQSSLLVTNSEEFEPLKTK